MENPDGQLKAELTLMYVSDLRRCPGLGGYLTAARPACKGYLENSGQAVHRFEFLTLLLSKEKGTKKIETEPSRDNEYIICIF